MKLYYRNYMTGHIKKVQLLVLWGLMVSFNTFSQDNQTNTGESPLVRGEQLLLAGSYAAASDVFQMADGLDRNDGLVGASKAFFMMGNSQEAMRVVEEAVEGDDYARFPLCSTQLAEVKRSIGRSREALAILEAIVRDMDNPPVRTLVQYGSLLKFVGQKQASIQILDRAVQQYNNGLVFSSEDVAMVAVASWLMDNFHDANSLFNEAIRANPNNLEAHVLWGDLFLEKYNASDAERSYQEALEINSRYTPALEYHARKTPIAETSRAGWNRQGGGR